LEICQNEILSQWNVITAKRPIGRWDFRHRECRDGKLMQSKRLWSRIFSISIAAAWLIFAVPAWQAAHAQGFVWPPHPPPPPVVNPSTPNTVPNPPPVPVPPGRAAPGGVSSGRVSPGRLAPGRVGALPGAEPCSVFDEEPCFPQILPPIGQDLRLTIVSTDDESSAKPPDADSSKHGGDDDAGDKRRDAKSLDSIAEMYAALRACWVPPVKDEARHGMQYTIRFAFKRDGEIVAPPRRTYSSRQAPDEVRNIYADAIDAALKRCMPLHFSAGMAGAVAGRPIIVRFVDQRTLAKSIEQGKSVQ
jgi:hypothetical protein